MPQINIDWEKVTIDWVEYVKKEDATIKKDNIRHPWRYWYPESNKTKHYYIDIFWNIQEWEYYAIDTAKVWNAFETRQEAEKELEKRKAIVTIKRYISDTFGVFEPDWSDEKQEKYEIFYNHDDEEFRCTDITWSYYTWSNIWYFSCEEHWDIIIEKFDKELRIIWDIE